MKIKENLIQICLLGAVLFGIPPAAQAQFGYSTSNGHVTITNYTGPGGVVVIPSTINGLPVTSIGQDAFAASPPNYVTSVSIPNSVTNIGAAAFYGQQLTNCIMGNSIISIGGNAFGQAIFSHNGVFRSVTVSIPDSVKSIGDYAFYNCDQLHITALNGVTNIGQYAFGNCSLGTLTIGNGIKSIGTNAFSQCLVILTIPNSVTNIADYAFDNSPFGGFISYITIPNGVISIGSYAFENCNVAAIPDSVTSIGDYAFNNSQMGSVTIGSGIKNIKATWFQNSAMSHVVIPASVTNIEAGAFNNCPFLSEVFIKGNAPIYGGGLFDFNAGNNYSITVFYFPGTTGWGSYYTNPNAPTVLWNAAINPATAHIGFSNGGVNSPFGFYVSGTPGLVLILEASTNNMASWFPVQTKTISAGGSVLFSDPQSTNHSISRMYRIAAN